MLREFLDRLLELSRPEVVTVDGRQYSTIGLTPVKDSFPPEVKVHSLTGLRDYIWEHDEDLPSPGSMFLVVNDPTSVSLVSHGRGEFSQRRLCATATIQHREFPFGQYLPQEEFIIALMTRFKQTDVAERVMSVVGNLAHDAGLQVEDDGVSQRVTVKAGVVRKSEVTLENPIVLRPYRTFLEVEQAACQLVLRLRKSKDGTAIEAALFEADGGQWKVEACRNVADWLKKEIPAVSVLA